MAGPDEFTTRQLIEHVLEVGDMTDRTLVSLPKQAIQMYCKFTEMGMSPAFTLDNLEQMLEDNIITNDMKLKMKLDNSNTFSFDDLGMTPLSVEKMSYDFLHRFRSGGHFARIQGYH